MILALSDPGTAGKVEGINYFADTLLFAGAILALAKATPRSDVVGRAVFQVLSERPLRQHAPTIETVDDRANPETLTLQLKLLSDPLDAF